MPSFKDLHVQCAYCQQLLPGALYQEHMKIQHQDKVLMKWKSCPDCKELFANEFKLTQHQLVAHTHFKIKCKVCPFTFTSYLVYAKHFKNDHVGSKLEGAFACKLCKHGIFQNQNLLRIHMNDKHDKWVIANWRVCKDCIDERFETEEQLCQHVDEYHVNGANSIKVSLIQEEPQEEEPQQINHQSNAGQSNIEIITGVLEMKVWTSEICIVPETAWSEDFRTMFG